MTHKKIRLPYLIFLGDVQSEPLAKTAFGIRDWLPENVVGQTCLPGCQVNLNLPEISPEEAFRKGARSMVIGVASVGGAIPSHWIPTIESALRAGLDIVSGMHTKLDEIPELVSVATQCGRLMHDIRRNDGDFPIASGRKRTGKRLLTVGTDCALGKKYTALAIAAAFKKFRLEVDFRATGQTGIMISGDGIAIDSVVADFVAGAAECLTPDNAEDHWDIVEGQGSLFHPAYAGVTLGLIHGTQPDALVLCHDPDRKHLNAFPDYKLPTLDEAIDRYLQSARLTNPDVRMAGISLNTSKMSEDARDAFLKCIADKYKLPAFDPLKSDLVPFVRHALEAQ